MAVMLGAHYLNAATSSLMARYDVVCIHTIVGYAPAHAAHFSTRADGYIWQSRDTKYRSAANLNGNHRVIAIENEDHGPAFGAWSGSNVPGFTEAQIESIARVCAWAYQTHGIPLVLCPDSKPDSRGIAYHRQGCDGNFSGYQYGGRVPGGELWSSAYGKVCPGDRRITQVINRIIPRARQLAGLDGGFLMALSDQEQRNLYNRVLGFLRQRWYVVMDGKPVAVSADHPGAVPATALDTLDGNYLVNRALDAEAAAKGAVAEAAAAKAEAAAAKAAVLELKADFEASRTPQA